MHNPRHAFFAVVTAALPFLAAHPAMAQGGTLNLANGDIVTVTSAGTISNRPGGTNTTSFYDAGSNFDAVDAEAGSRFTLAGGTIIGEDGDSALFANGATVNISSGLVSVTGLGTDGVDALGGSTVTISGGTFLASGGSTPPNANANTFASLPTPGPPLGSVDLYSEQASTINVTGGFFSASGTGYDGFFAQSAGVINIFGTGFTANGSAVTGPITTGSGTLSGTLLNGNTFTNLPYTVLGGTIQFTPTPAAAPEPSAWAALAIGAFGLGLLRLRKGSASRQSVSSLPA